MNKIFKVIWNPATGNYTVTSETAKSRGKKSGRSKLLISALVAGGLLSSFGALANAGNDNGQGVDYGSGSAGDGWVAIGKGAKANTFMNTSGSSTAVGVEFYSTKEFDRAMPDSQKGDNGFTIADVQSERQILEQTFKSRCTEAMEELGSINIVIEHAPSRLFEEKGRDNTKNLYTIMREKEDMFLNRHKDDKTPDKSSKSSETHKKDIGLDMSK